MAQVSIIIPMRNAEKFVRQSLRSLLRKVETSLEVIVVDDASTDGSALIVRQTNDDRVRMISGPGQGIAMAFNAGLAEAKGRIIMRCDADDLYPIGRIDQQVAWLKQHPGYGAVCAGFAMIDDSGKQAAELSTNHPRQDITEELRHGQTRTHYCTWAVRAEVLKLAGGCRAYFEIAEDVDLQFRLAGLGNVMYVPGCAYQYRLHSSSVTHKQPSIRARFFEEQARFFARQRLHDRQDDLDRGIAATPPAVQDGKHVVNSADGHLQGILLGHAWREHGAGRRVHALRLGWRAVRFNPLNSNAWKSWIMLWLKPAKH